MKMIFTKSYFLMLFVSLSGLFLSNLLIAHGGAKGVVKERMELMKLLGDRMKEMGAMVKGKVVFESAVIAANASKIEQAAPDITRLFPDGNLQKPSEALPKVWEEWGRFNEMTDRLTLEAGKLNDVAITGTQREIMIQFTKVGKACSSCHTDFRKQKEK